MDLEQYLVPRERLLAAAEVDPGASLLEQTLAIVRLLRQPGKRLPEADALTVYYSLLLWTQLLTSPWEAEHGHDAGLRQQAYALLEDPPEGVDWEVVEHVLKAAETLTLAGLGAAG